MKSANRPVQQSLQNLNKTLLSTAQAHAHAWCSYQQSVNFQIACIWLHTKHTHAHMHACPHAGTHAHPHMQDKTLHTLFEKHKAAGSSLIDFLAYLMPKSSCTIAWPIADCRAARIHSAPSYCNAPLKQDCDALSYRPCTVLQSFHDGLKNSVRHCDSFPVSYCSQENLTCYSRRSHQQQPRQWWR